MEKCFDIFMLLVMELMMAIVAGIFEVAACCFVFGLCLLTLSFTSLKEKEKELKYRIFRIVLVIIGIVFLLAAVGAFIFIVFVYAEKDNWW